MANDFPPPLLQPRRLGDLLLPNRVVMAPLTRGRASNSGHLPNDLMREYYQQRATAGLIVSEDGQGWLGAPGIYNRQQGAGWKAITNLSHVFPMRQFADLSGTPLAALAGDAVVHHFRKIYHGQLILNVGISREHAAELVAAGSGDFVAFGREYIANPDSSPLFLSRFFPVTNKRLVERIRLHAPLNEQRPEGYYGATASGYTDYPFLTAKVFHPATEKASLSR
jgi:2,4-dienoyl-CoA reductase-like NADH-dependent reductase (Old Yellow Enzyme family)